MERFGRYVLLERIGLGGMAEVHRAVAVGSAGFARQVAVKRVLPHLVSSEDMVTMLIEEAKLASTLSHANIVRVLDLGRADDSYFIAMDYVAGQPLSEVLARGRLLEEKLPLPFCLHVVKEALEALAYAHHKKSANGADMGIIHRDVSPENIMVGYDGSVLLMDFGIARAADRARVTLKGSLKGKPAYMSPEIVKGAPITQHVDLYATGVVFHELLTMNYMRGANGDLELFAEVARGDVPRFDALGVAVPQDVADIAYRALDVDPAKRFADADAFRVVVETAQSVHGSFGREQVMALMARLFAPELLREEVANARFHKVINDVHRATPATLGQVIARNSPPPAATPPRHRVRWAAASPLLLLLGGALWFVVVAQPAEPVTVETSPVPPPDQAPPAGIVQLTSEPEGASVTLGGKPMGTTPVHLRIEGTEPQAIVVEKPGFLSARRELTGATAPESLHVVLQLKNETAAAPVVKPVRPAVAPRRDGDSAPPVVKRNGTLTLQSKPWGRIVIDGKDTGRFTPAVEIPVEAGTHTVEIINDKLGIRASFTAEIEGGENLNVSKALK